MTQTDVTLKRAFDRNYTDDFIRNLLGRTGTKNQSVTTRTHTQFTQSAQVGMRGHGAVRVRYSDLGVHDLDKREYTGEGGVPVCNEWQRIQYLRIVSRDKNTSRSSAPLSNLEKKHAFPHKNPLLCSIGALGSALHIHRRDEGTETLTYTEPSHTTVKLEPWQSLRVLRGKDGKDLESGDLSSTMEVVHKLMGADLLGGRCMAPRIASINFIEMLVRQKALTFDQAERSIFHHKLSAGQAASGNIPSVVSKHYSQNFSSLVSGYLSGWIFDGVAIGSSKHLTETFPDGYSVEILDPDLVKSLAWAAKKVETLDVALVNYHEMMKALEFCLDTFLRCAPAIFAVSNTKYRDYLFKHPMFKSKGFSLWCKQCMIDVDTGFVEGVDETTTFASI